MGSFIANYSAITYKSKDKINGFRVNDTEIISARFHTYSSNTQAKKKLLITEIEWERCYRECMATLI